MCDPVTIGGLVLAGAGGAYTGMQQQKYVKAQNQANQNAYLASKAAREAELVRQKGFEDQAASEWNQTLDNLQPEDRAAEEAAAVSRFMSQYDSGANDTVAGQFLSGQDYAAPEVKNDIAAETAKAARATRERVASLAALAGSGSVDVARGLKLGDTSNRLATIGGLRRGSLGVSQSEQSIQPATVSPGNNILGSILTGVGSTAVGSGGGMPGFGTGTALSWAPKAVPQAARAGF